jgi:hypothetical protein
MMKRLMMSKGPEGDQGRMSKKESLIDAKKAVTHCDFDTHFEIMGKLFARNQSFVLFFGKNND